MSDRVPPKGKKSGKDKGAKKPGPKLAKDTIVPGVGHNSGQKIPGVIKLVDELLHIGEQKKSLGKAERDLRNKAKSEFGIMSGPLAHEMRLRKMDDDVRVQFESNHSDLKVALGYQPELDFAGAQPTRASASQQPSEAQIRGRKPQVAAEPEEGYSVEGDGGEEGEDEGFSESDQQNPHAEDDKTEEHRKAAETKAKLAIPAPLQRNKDVIEREG